MTGLAIAFLVPTAFGLYYFERTPTDLAEGRPLGWRMAAIWLPILLESLIGHSRLRSSPMESASLPPGV